MDRLRRLLVEWDRGGPRLFEYAIAIAMIAILAFLALALTADQTSHILSTVSGSV